MVIWFCRRMSLGRTVIIYSDNLGINYQKGSVCMGVDRLIDSDIDT